MTEILMLDEQIFHFINTGCSNPILDALVPYWRDKLVWIPVYFFILSFILANFSRLGISLIIAIFLTAGMSDIASSHLVKKNVQRLRPCNDVDVKEEMILRVRCGSGYSFTSSHAANHFAIATILVLLLGGRWKWIKWPLYLWALSIALGQVYVGVHYPIDILCGCILGYFCARIGYWIYLKIPVQFRPNLTAT